MALVIKYVQTMFITYRNCTCPCRFTSYNHFRNGVPYYLCMSKELGEDPVSNLQYLIFLPKLFFDVILSST